ncbi:hypothetical protein [Bilophila wadsworthia]|uniref:hypothetical protein n=1 Tax=Bilophila wadsworthia TaxID=35833 RepID=UPI00241D8DA5|nr:hypothetical protein [Bilophila wadsworthia]
MYEAAGRLQGAKSVWLSPIVEFGVYVINNDSLLCSAQVRDIVYNTILFEEKGWKVPYDFNRFIALCRTIEARGIRSIHLGFGNSELLDTAFGATATETVSALRPMPNGWPTTTGAGAASGSISAPPSIRFKP